MDIKRIEGLSNETYHTAPEYADYISSTQLKKYAVSPLAFKHSLDHPMEQTDSMRLGSLFHSAMEMYAKGKTIDDWLDTIAVFNPPVNPKTEQPYGATTKAYTEAYQQFLTDNQGKQICTAQERATVDDMVGSLVTARGGKTAEQVRKLLKWSKEAEVSYFLTDDEGIRLKVRPDLLTNGKLVDWKTTSGDLDEESVVRAIIKYRYDVSLSMYQHAIHEATGKWLVPILVFVQSKPPYDCIMVDISEWCYRYDAELDMVSAGIGAMEFRNLLDIHTRCVKENRWPGAESLLPSDDSVKILKPLVPHWFEKKYFEE